MYQFNSDGCIEKAKQIPDSTFLNDVTYTFRILFCPLWVCVSHILPGTCLVQ